MPDKKLTDTEIKKALELCKTNVMADCKKCPLRQEDGSMYVHCTSTLVGYALDLINRQEEENESLKAEVERLRKAIEKTDYAYFKKSCELDNLIYDIELLKQEKSVVKAEAYKEFADRLDKEFSGVGTCNYGCVHHKTRKVLNELVGDKNGKDL